ncbi:MAG: hypothetical protein E2O88_12100 [Bacteroidetes bacterium]|nr:MAG: hypothetical protein E2O88_12100 [Bacteroidota bacterium]
MRKTQLTLLALLIFQFACEPTEDTGPGPVTSIDYLQVSDEFNDMFKGVFRMTESLQIVSIVDQSKKRLMVKIDVENISKAATEHISGYFNGVQELNIRPFYPAPPFSTSFSPTNSIQTLNNVIDTARIFNDIQKMYIKALSRDIAGLDNYVDGFVMVTDFRNQITHSKELSENDKILLLEFASGTNALLEFMENDGAMAIQRSLQEMLGNSVPIGRAMECSVDWRGVWAGAVVGFTWGVVRGAFIGATAGTVTVPIVGTVTGAVSGAVILGAVGFAGGTVTTIAANLLTTCFGPNNTLQQTYPSCDAAWEAYLNNHTNIFPSDCFIIPVQTYMY